MEDIIPSKIKVNGKLYITVSIPFDVELDSNLVLYEDKLGNPHYEEEYEYSVDDIIDKLPKTKRELRNIISKRIKEEGNEVDLNDIDVSKITVMIYLVHMHTLVFLLYLLKK